MNANSVLQSIVRAALERNAQNLRAARAEHNQELRALQGRFTRTLRALEETSTREVKGLQARHSRDMKALQVQHGGDMKVMQEMYLQSAQASQERHGRDVQIFHSAIQVILAREARSNHQFMILVSLSFWLPEEYKCLWSSRLSCCLSSSGFSSISWSGFSGLDFRTLLLGTFLAQRRKSVCLLTMLFLEVWFCAMGKVKGKEWEGKAKVKKRKGESRCKGEVLIVAFRTRCLGLQHRWFPNRETRCEIHIIISNMAATLCGQLSMRRVCSDRRRVAVVVQ